MRHGLCLLAATLAAVSSHALLAQSDQGQEKPYAVEYYYKVKWGHSDEFLQLYKRNHYPILKRLKEMGRILEMSAAYPVYHAGEGSRWDFRYTIVYRSAAIAHDDFDESAIIQELYPDQERFRQEEQRRFEILLEHQDVPVDIDDLSDW